MIWTYSLKYDFGYIKGFSDISSKSIECLQKRQEVVVISMDRRVVHLPYKNISWTAEWCSRHEKVNKVTS